jgi:hypothetical protein
VNAVERAIQTFKDMFIAALPMIDCDFPLQLWDKLTPQVILCLNLLRALQIDHTVSAHKILNGPYDWNQYPLAPVGSKAIVYKDGNTRGLWVSQGINGWYLGPSLDYYCCNLYYIPETRAYQVLGSTELFPQHCQQTNMMLHQHFCALTDKLVECVPPAGATAKGCCLLKLLQQCINNILHPPPPVDKQWVRDEAHEVEQRVINSTPIITIPRLTDAPAIVEFQNPTAKQALKNTPRLLWRVTRNNTPGIIPIEPITQVPIVPAAPPQSACAMPLMAHQQLVTQYAINALTIVEDVIYFHPVPY